MGVGDGVEGGVVVVVVVEGGGTSSVQGLHILLLYVYSQPFQKRQQAGLGRVLNI